MKLTLIRHGETVGNTLNLLQGQTPGELTELGKTQAQKLAQRLKTEKFDSIYASDLKRVRDTLQPTLQHFPQTPLVYTEQLRERKFGEIEGRKISDFPGYDHDFAKYPSCETNFAMVERAGKFLQELEQKHPLQNILVFTHGALLTALLAHYFGKTLEETFQQYPGVRNTSVTILENKQIKLFNCTEHLE